MPLSIWGLSEMGSHLGICERGLDRLAPRTEHPWVGQAGVQLAHVLAGGLPSSWGVEEGAHACKLPAQRLLPVTPAAFPSRGIGSRKLDELIIPNAVIVAARWSQREDNQTARPFE